MKASFCTVIDDCSSVERKIIPKFLPISAHVVLELSEMFFCYSCIGENVGT